VRWWAALAGALAVAGCGSTHPTATIEVRSPAFAPGGAIPAQYTCSGRDVSPPLRWHGVPQNTRELALEMVDRDAPGGTFVHWAVAHLSAGLRGLEAGAVPPFAVQGRNDFNRVGYGGPCPPAGKPHRYVITVLAFGSPSGLSRGFRPAALQASRALASGRLTGTYGHP
jgi:Raf kinase inhibitor-like YbhB/YbcL family protein